MTNFLLETISMLEANGKTISDVVWIGNDNSYSTWEHFQSVANVEYDDGYGSQKIATDLMVVGKDWWMERHEYDGSEWWEFKQIPKQPEKRWDFQLVKTPRVGWEDLKEMNECDDE